ncbi:Putative ribonuclease H protein At1g65750 [Linum grandiflorum]
MTLPVAHLDTDSMVWRLETFGKFTIRSAYLLLKDLADEPEASRWKSLWRWQGPNKIRHFLWLASHNRLLTNEERGRRHLTDQVLCSFCSCNTESCIHVLGDCSFARSFWSKILPHVITATELSKEWSAWLADHIQHSTHSLVFGVGVWLLWRARNKRLFEQDTEDHMEVAHRCDYWVALISSSWKIGQLGREVRSSTRQTQLIGWRPGDEGWFTLSTDGSLRSLIKVATAGGVIRTDMADLLRLLLQIWGAALLLELKCKRLSMGLNLLGHWASDDYEFNPTRGRLLLSLLRILSWIINMRLLFCSLRNSAVVNGKFSFPTSTAKRIMLRIIWLILVILTLTGCIFLIHQIGACPTGYIMIL